MCTDPITTLIQSMKTDILRISHRDFEQIADRHALPATGENKRTDLFFPTSRQDCRERAAKDRGAPAHALASPTSTHSWQQILEMEMMRAQIAPIIAGADARQPVVRTTPCKLLPPPHAWPLRPRYRSAHRLRFPTPPHPRARAWTARRVSASDNTRHWWTQIVLCIWSPPWSRIARYRRETAQSRPRIP